MRWRVDTRFGYASFDAADEDKALELYRSQGVRLRACRDIYDEGTVVAGAPIFEDLTRKPWEES